MIDYFKWPAIVTVLGLFLGAWLGWSVSGTLAGAAGAFFITAILSILEISLSFDNAIVNANKLRDMSPIWRQRFLTWGILIAVFGMRIIFPLAVVCIAAAISPWAAVQLAWNEPSEYAKIMSQAHMSIAAFGGSFLMLVALDFFLDTKKEVHWALWIEARSALLGNVKGAGVAIVLALLLGVSMALSDDQQADFVIAGSWGILTFLAVSSLGHFLDRSTGRDVAVSGGLGAFLYLEVLDASFSFDGVVGAFALTQNLFIIAIGLGIGAMYVRAMTIMLVDNRTLNDYRYLEHGAFYAVLALSMIMFLQAVFHVPEIVTGLIGAGLICLAFLSSLRFNRRVEHS
ncbi:DUF475 domain-containing protein [Ahrensia sp. 13_GOM-1096m]|uniref:DUF475 domain-containing protein n=1 Tax=Ahrensia sp. 13_GOM-1096m TaxID=1380380 RepID=UPI00047C2D4E|nr:DUF475 domain-containing protein [Ahrensia sp. 13_GOM-1096m]